MERPLVLLLVLQRGIAVLMLLALSVPYPAIVVVAVLAIWNVSLFVIAWRQGRPPWWIAVMDVGVAVALLAMAAVSGQDDWAYQVALAAAAMAAAALKPRSAAVAVCALAGAFTGETLARKGNVSLVELTGDLFLLLAFAIVVASGADALRRHSRRADRASPPPALVRDLHDTALATLSAIAGGQLDHQSEQVRRRAARDVAHIRRLLLSESTESESALDARLREVVAGAELFGLRVHWQGDPVSPGLPPAAVAALADAAREALNNVAAHAGTADCWLTLITDRGRVTVRVVDRGRGFDPANRPPGFGMRRSLLERMTACGGAVRVTSGLGTGTCVDLMWPK